MTDGREKEALRAALRARRAALDTARRQADAEAVCARVLALPVYRHARVVMAYAAVRGELDVAGVLEDVLASGRVLAMPRCEGPGRMRAYAVENRGRLAPGTFGIQEPDGSCPAVKAGEIGLILVPGTAFDRAGNRLGQGGGYYDRFLAGTRAVRVGICHDFALLDRVPCAAHDVRMDAVLTPSFTLSITGRVEPDHS